MLTLLFACSSNTGLGTAPVGQDIVDGTGGMQVDPAELVISDIESGYSRSGTFTVTSTGDGNLLLYELSIVANAQGAFIFEEEEDITLAPGQTASYVVAADLPGTDAATGQLRIRSSDPQNASFLLDLLATPVGWEPSDSGGDSG